MRTALTLAAAALATGAVVAAPAGIASADNSAQNTINYWEQQGYQVNIDRVGSGPTQRVRRHERAQSEHHHQAGAGRRPQ